MPVKKDPLMGANPVRRQSIIEEKLPKGFKNKLIELEFTLEKGTCTQELVIELTEMYTQAAGHYDLSGEKGQAEIYRSKIQMLFMKP